MNELVKLHLIDYCQREGWGTDFNTLMEVITEGKVLHEETVEKHRWYDIVFRVTEIEGKLIGYDHYHITGDTSWRDMGLDYMEESVCFVVRKEVVTSAYVKVEK